MKTPQQTYPELSQALGTQEIYLKREDLHNYGSHKGRSIPLMIKKYLKDGINEFAISSSGNAALASLLSVQSHNRNNTSKIKLKIYVGKNINPNKLKTLLANINDVNISLEQVDNPKQEAFLQEKNNGIKFLRQSTDDLALEGYAELADDLIKIENLQAVFIPTSSGTTAQALGENFYKLDKKIQIHIVQTVSCHPMASEFDKNFEKKENSMADAIVDNIAHRKEKVLEVIKNSDGFGWVVNDEEIKSAMELIENTCKIKISANSALSIAGLNKALQNNFKFSGPVVCLITGR